MLFKRLTKIVKIRWLVNNLRNILISANSQKKYFEKVITFQIYLIKKYWYLKKILKNKLLDLDKCFYYQNYSHNQIHKLAIFNISK